MLNHLKFKFGSLSKKLVMCAIVLLPQSPQVFANDTDITARTSEHLSIILEAMEHGVIVNEFYKEANIEGPVCIDYETCKRREEEVVKLIKACVVGALGAGSVAKGIHEVFGSYYAADLIRLRILLAGFGMSVPGVNVIMGAIAAAGCAGNMIEVNSVIEKEIYQCKLQNKNDQAFQLELLRQGLERSGLLK